MYCKNCGNEVNDNAVVCLKCGAAVNSVNQDLAGGKDWLTSLLLCFFLGYFGIHRFYTGHTAIGVIQLLTFGGCGIWTLIDFITILTNSYTDSNGQKLVKKN